MVNSSILLAEENAGVAIEGVGEIDAAGVVANGDAVFAPGGIRSAKVKPSWRAGDLDADAALDAGEGEVHGIGEAVVGDGGATGFVDETGEGWIEKGDVVGGHPFGVH